MKRTLRGGPWWGGGGGGGGGPMSPVDFKKWKCPCRYLRNVPVDFEIAEYRLSILRNGNVSCR